MASHVQPQMEGVSEYTPASTGHARCMLNEVHEISAQTRALMPGKDIVFHSDFLKNL